MDRDRGGGVCCQLEVSGGCSCQVNILQCTVEGVEVVVNKYIRWKSVPLGYCSLYTMTAGIRCNTTNNSQMFHMQTTFPTKRHYVI